MRQAGRMRVLVVDDHRPTLEFLDGYLSGHGHRVLPADSGTQALTVAEEQAVDAVVLDLGLPDVDGLAVCRALRRRRGQLPILMLTARDRRDDELAGFAATADDYVRKPVDPPLLLARLTALHRRSQAQLGETTLRLIGGVEVDLGLREVRREGVRQPLGPKSFDVLAVLVTNPGRVWTKAQLLERAWGDDLPGSQAVEWHISQVRGALGDTGRQLRYVLTRPRVGYLMPRDVLLG